MSKVCVITGAGGVLCSAFAAEMAKNGYGVALLDLNYEAAEAVAAGIRQNGGNAIAYAANVLEKTACVCYNGTKASTFVHKELFSCNHLRSLVRSSASWPLSSPSSPIR